MTKSLSVIITAEPRSAVQSIEAIVSCCRKLQPTEIVMVVDKENEALVSRAKQWGCTVHPVDRSLNLYGKRAVGAETVKGDVLLFLDGGRSCETRHLIKIVEPAMYSGADAVLIQRKSLVSGSRIPSAEAVWAASWNRFTGRDDLYASSLFAAPFVLSRRIVQQAGAQALRNPVLFYTTLLQSRMHIRHPAGMTEAAFPRIVFDPRSQGSLSWELSEEEQFAVTLYLEAFGAWIPKPRGGFTDGERRRELVEGLKAGKQSFPIHMPKEPLPASSLYSGKKLSVIIPARNEEATIQQQIRQILSIEPAEIIVVANGTNDRTAELALAGGASVVNIPEALGTDTGRAVGAYFAKGDIVLFVDAEPVIAAEDLYPFALAVERGADLALNESRPFAETAFTTQGVTPAMFALNMALGKKHLGAGSMVMIPFAMSRKALRTIGWEHLLCPPRAMAMGVLKGLKVIRAHRVDVEKNNKLRPEKHATGIANQQIIGDHIEAIHYLLEQRGK